MSIANRAGIHFGVIKYTSLIVTYSLYPCKVLRDAQLDKGDVDEVVLMGGSTHIPKIQQTVNEFFKGRGNKKNEKTRLYRHYNR